MKRHFSIGIEDEGFILDQKKVVPQAHGLLTLLQTNALKNGFLPNQFSPELFAGQIESKTTPTTCPDAAIGQVLALRTFVLQQAESFCAEILYADFVEESEISSLEVYSPNKRYHMIWRKMPHAVRVAASQVASFQIHVGLTPGEAIRVLNYINEQVITELKVLGDNSCGKRMKAYRLVTHETGIHPHISTVQELYTHTHRHGTSGDNWDWVRWKPETHTLEFRMFGNHENPEVLRSYVDAVLRLVTQSL